MEEKRILTISNSYEYNLLLNALVEYRNQLLKEDKSTKIINELIMRLLHTPIKKKSIFKKDIVYER